MKVLTQILFFASLFVISGQVLAQATIDEAVVKNISAHEAQKVLQKEGIILLDIRTPQEFNASKIEGAINIDFYNRAFAENLNKLDKKETYFVYCRSGNRTGQSMRIFKSLGFTDIYHLHRGIVDWKGSGYTMTR